MNIVFVVPEDYKRIGGEYLIINNYTRLLELNGHKMYLVEFPYSFHNSNAKEEYKNELFDILSKYSCQAVITYALNISVLVIPLLKSYGFEGRKICFMVDSMSLYSESLLKYEKRFSKRIKERAKKVVYTRRERKCIQNYDAILYVSSVDKRYAIKHFGDAHKIVCIPNGTTLPNSLAASRKESYPVLGMLTGLGKETATNNLFPFIEEIFPKIRKEFPEIKLVIAGRGASEETKQMLSSVQNVTFLGEVETLNQYYDNVDITIVTVKKECGVINRVLEGWAYKKVVMGFARNFAAFEYAKAEDDYLAADSAEDFILQIGRTIDSKELMTHLAENGRVLVERYYTWEASAKLLMSVIEGRANL